MSGWVQERGNVGDGETPMPGAVGKAYHFETGKGHLTAWLVPTEGEANGKPYTGWQWRNDDGSIAGGLKTSYVAVGDAIAAARGHGRFRGVEHFAARRMNSSSAAG